ncbi:MAG: hypothetical protein Q9181_003004 [Wetmoreana brouardii]
MTRGVTREALTEPKCREILKAVCRSKTFTEETKLRPYLKSHIEASRWPLECPHPLCHSTFGDRKQFQYHLSDVHGLSKTVTELRFDFEPKLRSLESANSGTEISASRKRKRVCTKDIQLPGSIQQETFETRGPLPLTANESIPNHVSPPTTCPPRQTDYFTGLLKEIVYEASVSYDTRDPSNASTMVASQDPLVQPENDIQGIEEFVRESSVSSTSTELGKVSTTSTPQSLLEQFDIVRQRETSPETPQIVRPDDIHYSLD